MDLELNFLGVNVADFETSFHFYTEVLGIEARHSKPLGLLRDHRDDLRAVWYRVSRSICVP